MLFPYWDGSLHIKHIVMLLYYFLFPEGFWDLETTVEECYFLCLLVHVSLFGPSIFNRTWTRNWLPFWAREPSIRNTWYVINVAEEFMSTSISCSWFVVASRATSFPFLVLLAWFEVESISLRAVTSPKISLYLWLGEDWLFFPKWATAFWVVVVKDSICSSITSFWQFAVVTGSDFSWNLVKVFSFRTWSEPLMAFLSATLGLGAKFMELLIFIQDLKGRSFLSLVGSKRRSSQLRSLWPKGPQ